MQETKRRTMSEREGDVYQWGREAWERMQADKADEPLYLAVLAILTRYDPIGIGQGIDNPYWQTEYSSETDTILPRVLPSHSVDAVGRIVHEEFVRWFDPQTAGSPEKYDDIAGEIWQVLHRSE